MPATSRADDLAQRRFRKLLFAIGEPRGHGWRSELAEELGVSQEHMSRLLSGKRRASWEILQAAADRYGFNVEYYSARPEDPDGVSFADFMRQPIYGPAPGLQSSPGYVAYVAQLARDEVERSGEVPMDLALALARAVLELPMVAHALGVSLGATSWTQKKAHALALSFAVPKTVINAERKPSAREVATYRTTLDEDLARHETR